MKKLSLYTVFFLGILMACSQTQESSIFQAVKNRDLEKVQKLVAEDKSLVGEINEQGETPLHIAAKTGDVSIVYFFIEQNINLDIQDQQGNTPLILATTAGYYEIVKQLINAKADLTIVNNRAYNAPKVAFDMNKPEILRLFLAQGITKQDYYPKLIPTKLAQKTTITPFKDAEKRILSAIQNNDINLFTEYLEDKDTKVNYNAQDENGKTLLHITAEMTNSNFLKVYLENDRSTIDMRDKNGVNALMFAIMAKNVDSIRQLILAGGNLRTTDNQFKNILDYAVITEDTPTFNMVIRNFKSLNDKDMLGNTPLHYAAQLKENSEILTLLLESGANVNVENKLVRDTPLHIAAKAGNAKAVDTLIKFGSNPSSKNAEGKTAKDYMASLITTQDNLPEKVVEEETPIQSLPEGENLIEMQEDVTNDNSEVIEEENTHE